MNKIILLSLLLTSPLISHSQSNHKIDSLKKMLAKLPVEGRSYASDTLRVRVLCGIGEQMLVAKNDSTFFTAKQALAIAEKINDRKGLLKTNMLLAKNFQTQPLRATEYLFRALAIGEELKSYKDLIRISIFITYNFQDQGESDSFDKALKYAKYHSKLCKLHGTQEQYLLSINQIAILLFEKKEFNKSLQLLDYCERQNKKLQSVNVSSVTLINIAKLYQVTRKYDLAIDRLQKALLNQDGYEDKVSFVNFEISQILFEKKDFSRAKYYATIAKENTKSNDFRMIAKTEKILSDIYKSMNRKDLGFLHLEQYIYAKLNQDSVKNYQLNRFLILDYQSEKQLTKINLLNDNVKQQESRNKLLIIIIFSVLLTISIVLYLYHSLRNKNVKINEQNYVIEELNRNLENKVKERTLKLLEANDELIRKNKEISEALYKGQTIERKRVAAELHDNLGGTISAIKWRLESIENAQLNEDEQKIYGGIMEMISNVYSEVRLISHNLLPIEFEKYGLIGALQKLFEEINLSRKILIKFTSIGDITIIDQKIALELYSICLELINNILKHSKASKSEWTLQNVNNKILFIIRDNGIGFNSTESNSGMGIKNLKNRLDSIGGKILIRETIAWKTEIEMSV